MYISHCQHTHSITNSHYRCIAWQRVRTANQLANSGPEWSDLVGQYNSGTYNNQYMILDGKLFTPGQAMQENTLYVVEQIPGLVVGGDASNELEKGYWSSYNVPYHKEIYVKSGYQGWCRYIHTVSTSTKSQDLPSRPIYCKGFRNYAKSDES